MRIGFDLDGVISATPFGRLAVHAPDDGIPELPANYRELYEAAASHGALRLAIEYLRFAWRRPSAEARELLAEMARDHEIFVVTGRSRAGQRLLGRWLRTHGFQPYVRSVHMAPPGLRPAQHKLATSRTLGLQAHIDDDPRTAYYLARHGVEHVYLYDHAGAHGDEPLPPRLVLLRRLNELAELARA